MKGVQIHPETGLLGRCFTMTKIYKEEVRLLDETSKEKNI